MSDTAAPWEGTAGWSQEAAATPATSPSLWRGCEVRSMMRRGSDRLCQGSRCWLGRDRSMASCSSLKVTGWGGAGSYLAWPRSRWVPSLASLSAPSSSSPPPWPPWMPRTPGHSGQTWPLREPHSPHGPAPCLPQAPLPHFFSLSSLSWLFPCCHPIPVICKRGQLTPAPQTPGPPEPADSGPTRLKLLQHLVTTFPRHPRATQPLGWHQHHLAACS